MQIDTNEEIKQTISVYENHIEQYWYSFNTEGVWLFLATLGCWSVNEPNIQVFAIVITAVLFSYRIYLKLPEKRSFKTISAEIQETITQTIGLDNDTGKARMYELEQINRVKLSLTNTIKSTIIFLVCYSFLGLTLIHSTSSIS